MKEIKDEWRDVPGFEGLYQISISTPEGKCRSLNYHQTGTIREMSNNITKRTGYICWSLRKDGKTYIYQAARWIALTYPELVENEYFEGAQIDHKSTIRTDNRPLNLRWVSAKGNQNNPLTLKHKSETHMEKMKNRPDQSKWVIKLNTNNEILHFYPSIQQAARENNICHSGIIFSCQGKCKTYKGFVWKYVK